MDDTKTKQGRFIKAAAAASLLDLLLCSAVALGDPVVTVNTLALDYRDFTSGGYEPLIHNNALTDRELGKGLGLTMNLDIFQYAYFNNLIHGTTDENRLGGNGQFRAVGWQYEVGLRLMKSLPIDIYKAHHSQHVLDTTTPDHFPVHDSVGFRITFISNQRREALIPW